MSTTKAAHRTKIDLEDTEFGFLPFVSEDTRHWNPPSLAGDPTTTYSAEWLLGKTYAAAFLQHALAYAKSNPHAARERLVTIFEQMMGGYPSNIAKGFVAGLGDALAHGAVDLDAGCLWVRPTAPTP